MTTDVTLYRNRLSDEATKRLLRVSHVIEEVKHEIETHAKRIAAYEELAAQVVTISHQANEMCVILYKFMSQYCSSPVTRCRMIDDFYIA